MKTIYILGFTIILLSLGIKANAQDKSLTFDGYIETYFSYDFSSPDNHKRPAFIYSHNRHNEFNLNLGIIKVNYASDKVRGNLALMTGTYANANLAAEPSALQNIFEANVGVKISKKKNLWIDAGVLPSHIGFESAIGALDQTLTRSISAENSPYFETGTKITYITDDGKWVMCLLILNGWQRMQRVDGNQTPAFGHQLTYTPSANFTLNSSSFIGNDSPASLRKMRYFHDFYGVFKLSEKVSLITGFDIGFQQKAKNSNSYSKWFTPTVILKFSPLSKLDLAARVEYYDDHDGVIIASSSANGFKTFGYSANADIHITDKVVWRIEARAFDAQNTVFINRDNNPDRQNYAVSTALAVSL